MVLGCIAKEVDDGMVMSSMAGMYVYSSGPVRKGYLDRCNLWMYCRAE